MPTRYSDSELLELWGCQGRCPAGQETRLQALLRELKREGEPLGRSPSEWVAIHGPIDFDDRSKEHRREWERKRREERAA